MKGTTKKVLILTSTFLAVFVFGFVPFIGEVRAYTIEETLSGALPFSTWADAYETDCDNEFWVGQGQVCDASGYVPDHNFSLSAVRLYNVQCDSGERATKTFKAQIRLNSTGAVLAETETATINCVASPPSGSANTPEYDLAVVGGAYALNTATTYAFSIAVTANYTDNLWTRTANASAYGASLMSGDAPTIVEMYFPGDSTASSSLPNFTNWIVTAENRSPGNPVASLGVAYSLSTSSLWNTTSITPSYIDWAYSGTIATTTYVRLGRSLLTDSLHIPETWYAQARYYASPGEYTESEIQTFTFAPNGEIPEFDNSTSTGALPGGYGTGSNLGLFLNSTSTLISPVDCTGYTIGLFSSTTLDGIGCVVKKTASEILNWLFVPDPAAWVSLSESMQKFREIEPFNTIYSVRSTLAGNLVTSTPATLSMTLPIPNHQNTEIVLLSSQPPFGTGATSTAMQTAIKDTTRAIIWVGVAFLALAIILV